MYQDFENKKLRNLTPEEVCAMYHFHNEYARLGIGAIAFYASLTLDNKNFIARMVKDVVKHCPTMRAPVHAEQKCPTCDGRGMRKYGDEPGLWHCYDCNGTGISKRSAGG